MYCGIQLNLESIVNLLVEKNGQFDRPGAGQDSWLFLSEGRLGAGVGQESAACLSEDAVWAGVGQDQGRILSDGRPPGTEKGPSVAGKENIRFPGTEEAASVPGSQACTEGGKSSIPVCRVRKLKDFTISFVRFLRILGLSRNHFDLSGQKRNASCRYICLFCFFLLLLLNNKSFMAYYIKPAPVLEGKSAQQFREKVEVFSTSTKGRIDFARQAASAKRILERSKSSIF